MEEHLIGWIIDIGRKRFDGTPDLDLRFDLIDLNLVLQTFGTGPIEVIFKTADENDEYVKALRMRPDLKKPQSESMEGDEE